MRSSLTLVAATLLIPLTAFAQTRDFPQRPIRIVVPVPPGGVVDAATRLIVPKMSESLGQSVVIDNRSGAATNIGMEMVARAPGDGYTLLANTLPFVANAALFPKLSFSPEKDFAPLSIVMSGATVIVTHPSLPVRNVRELIALAKANPGSINYASAGGGTITHLGPELFKYMSGTKMVDIQYKGAGPAIAALMAGECQMGFQTLLASIGQIKSGRLRALAVTSRKRQPLLIEVPTVAESGAPNYVLEIWVGLVALASTPPPIVRLLNEHIVKAARSPEVAERFAREGAEVVANTPEQFRKVLTDETAMWGKVIKEMGIRGE